MHESRPALSLNVRETQITTDDRGHCLNSTQCFSPDGNTVVYDTRNEDAKLAANGQIRMLNLETGEDVLLYETQHQTEYGPGVGAATFSPDGNSVLFLGGIQNASADNPYSFTRRTGIGITLNNPGFPIWMDARNIQPPFTPGALRGGTHAHSWSGDGEYISFTYNDHILAEASKSGKDVIDTRTVGVMFPKKVLVPAADNIENKNGEYFSVLISRVVKQPTPGTDQISKAFDDCWIGKNGYLRPDGARQQHAIAFQGHTCTVDGSAITAIYVVDIPADLPDHVDTISAGTMTDLPEIPQPIRQRRITGDEVNVSASPRHWLRSTPDGALIGFLAADENDIIQLWGISPNGGPVKQLSFLPVSIEGPFNFSPDGKYAGYLAGGNVYITRIEDGISNALTSLKPNIERVGPVIWSPDKYILAYNAYVENESGRFLQIFTLTVSQ
jgi:WD40 repeat protein